MGGDFEVHGVARTRVGLGRMGPGLVPVSGSGARVCICSHLVLRMLRHIVEACDMQPELFRL